MKHMPFFLLILATFYCNRSFCQKKYGYTVLYVRCGNKYPQQDKVYFSPIIELNTLNFPKFTDGMDPAFPKFSVGYYNFAIAKWFEIFLKEQYHISVNDPERYERNATSMVYDNKNDGSCNADKTEAGCFFTDQQKLIMLRTNEINKSKLPENNGKICEVIEL